MRQEVVELFTINFIIGNNHIYNNIIQNIVAI